MPNKIRKKFRHNKFSVYILQLLFLVKFQIFFFLNVAICRKLKFYSEALIIEFSESKFFLFLWLMLM